MTAEEVYDQLFATSEPIECDAFDRHVVAAILSLAISEGEVSGAGPLQGLGLSPVEFAQLLAKTFPQADRALGLAGNLAGPEVDHEEQSVRDILSMYCTSGEGLEPLLCSLIARRCKSPHHLWQDLGLRDRGELSQLMETHFQPLARKNRNDMKWKKFLYRMVCGSEGFTLCTAPVCAECDDFQVCFGSEDGEALLARVRNGRSADEEAAVPLRPAAE